MERREELIEAGWVRRFTAEEPRLSEMKQYYESKGLEVRIEAGTPEEDPDCLGCLEAEGRQGRYGTIYTRGEEVLEERRADDELF